MKTRSARADSWDEVLAAARGEGELVALLGGSASRNYRPIFKHCEDKFGIRTVVSTGSGSKQADRLLAERRSRVWLKPRPDGHSAWASDWSHPFRAIGAHS